MNKAIEIDPTLRVAVAFYESVMNELPSTWTWRTGDDVTFLFEAVHGEFRYRNSHGETGIIPRISHILSIQQVVRQLPEDKIAILDMKEMNHELDN